MIRSIKITFPVKKKNRDDTYKTMAQYEELGDARCFILPETNSTLKRKDKRPNKLKKVKELVQIKELKDLKY